MHDAEVIAIPIHLFPDNPTLEHWNDYLFPKPPSVEANIGAATARVYRQGILNSLIIAGSVTFLNLTLGTLAATRYRGCASSARPSS
jgi:ABC-type glycerol-3-phosphate transport system permease component